MGLSIGAHRNWIGEDWLSMLSVCVTDLRMLEVHAMNHCYRFACCRQHRITCDKGATQMFHFRSARVKFHIWPQPAEFAPSQLNSPNYRYIYPKLSVYIYCTHMLPFLLVVSRNCIRQQPFRRTAIVYWKMKPTIVALALPMMILIAASFVDADCNKYGCCWCDNWGNTVECAQHKVPSFCQDGGKTFTLQ